MIVVTKKEMVEDISRKANIEYVDVLVTMEAYFKYVKQCLVLNKKVSVRGFGTFKPEIVSGKRVAIFVPSKNFKNLVEQDPVKCIPA